jgi:hypothetical protein
MPALVYCLIEAQDIEVPAFGLGDLPVESVGESGLRCFFAPAITADQVLGLPAKQAALAFHHVVQTIFHQVAVIPFRFPTILQSEAELRSYLSNQEQVYHEALNRLCRMVQMDVQLSHSLGEAANSAETSSARKSSGAEYLRSRQSLQNELAKGAAAFRDLGDGLVRDWRERPSAQNLRCFALIERDLVNDFKRKAATVQLVSNVQARVSGPWPASEFVLINER